MNIFCKWHFHNASKEVFWPKNILNFMQGFKNAVLAIFPFCQNGTFEPLHEIKKFFGSKDFFRGIMNVPYTKNIQNLFQGLPNPRLRSVKVKTETFLKKDSRDFKNSFYLGFLWISSASLKSKIRRCSFFGIHNCKKTVCLWTVIDIYSLDDNTSLHS